MSSLGNKKVFANNLNYYLARAGKSRKEVCKALGFGYSAFCEWCNANKYPRIDKIEKMANYFGIQKSDLIEEHDFESEQKTAIEQVKVALFSGSTEITEEMWEEVKNFAKFIEQREAKKND